MPSRDEIVAHYAKVSGRQVDDMDYYVVLAKWKLAVVLEQGFQRAGDDEKLQAFGPIVLDLMAERGRHGRVVRLLRARRLLTCAPRSAAATAAPRWSRWSTSPPPSSARARCGCASPSPR